MSNATKKKVTKTTKAPVKVKAPAKGKEKAPAKTKEKHDEEVKRGKEIAARTMTTAEVEALDVEAVRRIARASLDVERREGELAQTRRVCNEQVSKARVDLKATIESAGGVAAKNAKKKLDQILIAHQRVEEVEAGRKMELHLALDAKKKARTTLRKAFENAKQVEIKFTGDEPGVSPTPDEASADAQPAVG